MNTISSLYVHFPFCKTRCNYCDFFSQTNCESSIGAYSQQLERDLQFMKEFNDSHHAALAPLKTLYVGGGTPGLWGESGRELLKRFVLADDCEFTIEINPGHITFDEIRCWRDIGVNRFSIGTQSLDPFYLEKLGRKHSVSDTLELVEFLSNEGINFSVDFMLGLPESDNRDLQSEVETLLQYNVPHISAYILTVGENYKYFNQLPDDEFISSEYLMFSNLLRSHGFDHYEVSNFAQPNKHSKHNLKYWKSLSVAAIGTSAVGSVVTQNYLARYNYLPNGETETEIVTGDDLELEKLFLGLRSSVGIDANKYLQAASWVNDGLATLVSDRIVLTPRGFLIADSLISELF